MKIYSWNTIACVSTAFFIGNKIVRLITDNASNNLSAFGELVIPGFESYFVPDDAIEEVDDDTHEINLNMSEGHCPDDDDIPEESEKTEELLRLPCFIHSLQLVVKDGLKESACTRSAMAKVAEIAKLSHTSVPVAEKLHERKLSYTVYPSMIDGVSGLIWSYDNMNETSMFNDTHPLYVSASRCNDSSICVWYISPC